MECVGFVLALIFFSLLFLNVPVAVAIGSATMLGVAVAGGSFRPEIIVPERMMFGINSFPLLAIPFFILYFEIYNFVADLCGEKGKEA